MGHPVEVEDVVALGLSGCSCVGRPQRLPVAHDDVIVLQFGRVKQNNREI